MIDDSKTPLIKGSSMETEPNEIDGPVEIKNDLTPRKYKMSFII